jgi:hypothetical protein
MELNELTWYIVPYNRFDVRILGADPTDTKKELEIEDGCEFYLYIARVHFILLDLSDKLKNSGPEEIKYVYYEPYLEPHKYKKYSWEEIKKISIDILFNWHEKRSSYNVRENYKTKR